jgi:hypothetical protein
MDRQYCENNKVAGRSAREETPWRKVGVIPKKCTNKCNAGET